MPFLSPLTNFTRRLRSVEVEVLVDMVTFSRYSAPPEPYSPITKLSWTEVMEVSVMVGRVRLFVVLPLYWGTVLPLNAV